MVVASSKSKDQPSKIVNPARGQLNRKKYISIFGSFGLEFLYLYFRDCLSPRSWNDIEVRPCTKAKSYGAGNSKFLKIEIWRISDFGRTSASQQKRSYGTLETEN